MKKYIQISTVFLITHFIQSQDWSMTIIAQDQQDIGASDYIILEMCEGCHDWFHFGEDEYDLPNPSFGNRAAIDLYVNGSEFYLYRDIKSNDFSEKEYQAWAISSESYEVNQFRLDWNMGELDKEVHLVIDGDAIDMRNQETLIVNNLDDAFIVVGNVVSFLDPVPDQFNLSNAYPNELK